MAKTKEPTGLSISRQTYKYTFKWKKGETYDAGQQFKWRTKNLSKKWRGWKKVNVGKTTTQTAVSFDGSALAIEFAVRGKTDKNGWSAWETKTLSLAVPSKPSVSATLDESLSNVTKFSYSVSMKTTDSKPYTKMVWESILIPDAASADGSTYKSKFKSSQGGWKTGITTTTSSSQTITEDTTFLAEKSYTRFFRVKSVGTAGSSAWSYSYHVYSSPKAAVISNAEVIENGLGGINIKVTWEATANAAYPIDSTTVEYAITTPAAGLECPSGASFTEANVSRDTSGKDAASFVVDSMMGDDDCVFVRVNTQHDRNTTYGAPALGAVGKLSDPSGLSVSTDDSTFRATVSATNNSDVPDSFLAVTYRTAGAPEDDLLVGVIAHGQSSVTVQCPDWSEEEAVAFGVHAVVGSYTAKTRADGVSVYEVNERMVSAKVWDGGSVPQAPSGVTVTPTNISGTVRVAWNWDWASADGAVLAWSDHEDAWESTDEPEEYEISNLHRSQWNISGLETGQKWYVRVRLTKGTEEKTYGPWSDIAVIDLSSAPNIPVLTLSEEVITEDGEVTASWAYSTTDGTPQAYAEVCEASVGASVTYGDVVAHSQTAQHVSISAEELGWQAGETHYLCVRVTSASGRKSDNWSDPVAVNVADPIECEITETSLQVVSQEVNPRSFEGDIVTFDTEIAEDVPKAEVSLEPIQDLSHGDPSPTNICPIDGYEDVGVSVVGKNLVDISRFADEYPHFCSYSGDDLEVNSTGAGTLYSTGISVNIPAGSVASGIITHGTAVNVRVRFIDEDDSIIDVTHFGNAGYVLAKAIKAIRFNWSTAGTFTLSNFQIELGTTATDYEPYAGIDYTTDLGRTVYGGTVDLASGVLVVDRGYVDLGTLSWSNFVSGAKMLYMNASSFVKAPPNNQTLANILCSEYETITRQSVGYGSTSTATGVGVDYSGNLFVIDNSGAWANVTNVAEAKATLNGVYLVYELATPQTYQLTSQQIQTLIGTNNVFSDSGDIAVRIAESVYEVNALTELPLTVTSEGAGEGGTTTLIIERAADYHMDRPDETDFNGFEGETVAIITPPTGETEASFDLENLIGTLDDEAQYRLIATATDGYGQSASDSIDFEVHWNHQAIIPTATAQMDNTNNIAKITVPKPTGALDTDTFDIYRLSADRPELIVQNGTWGTTYVDPYPTIGVFGGHRVVFKTVNGDYITEDNLPAWTDLGETDGDILESSGHIIDFDGESIMLNYNLDLSNSWEKDFIETRYLGGSIQGDWNPAVSRNSSVKATLVAVRDPELIRALRRLALHAGVCHIRTKDGSSYSCDIQVQEDYANGKLADFSLTVTRVDSETLDGLTLEQWAEQEA